jgi:hypothetical protein
MDKWICIAVCFLTSVLIYYLLKSYGINNIIEGQQTCTTNGLCGQAFAADSWEFNICNSIAPATDCDLPEISCESIECEKPAIPASGVTTGDYLDPATTCCTGGDGGGGPPGDEVCPQILTDLVSADNDTSTGTLSMLNGAKEAANNPLTGCCEHIWRIFAEGGGFSFTGEGGFDDGCTAVGDPNCAPSPGWNCDGGIKNRLKLYNNVVRALWGDSGVVSTICPGIEAHVGPLTPIDTTGKPNGYFAWNGDYVKKNFCNP